MRRNKVSVSWGAAVLLSSTFLLTMTGCSIREAVRKAVDERTQTKLPDKPLNREQISEDVDYYVRTVEKICPYPYMYSSKIKIDSIANDIKKNQSLEPILFYKKLLQLQGAYNIAHHQAVFPEKEYHRYFQKGGTIFPLECEFRNDSLFVVSTSDKSITVKKDEVILSINGKSADSLFRNFTSYVGGLSAWKAKQVSKQFAKFLWLNNIDAPFTIETIDKNHKKSNLKIEGVNPETQLTNSDQTPKTENFDDVITYQRLNDSIAVIDFKTMGITSGEKFSKFLKETFKDIQSRKTKLLVVDLRKNGGGNSEYGDSLLHYFNSKPYRMAAEKKWMVSQEYKDNFKQMLPWYARSFAVEKSGLKDYFEHKNGELFDFAKEPKDTLTIPKSNDLRYKGIVWIIIGNGTFSSAMMTANAIEDFKLATLIGQPTAECPNDLGENVPVWLPHSNICCWVSSALFTRANGNSKDINPVLPNIYVEQAKLNSMNTETVIKYVMNHKMMKPK